MEGSRRLHLFCREFGKSVERGLTSVSVKGAFWFATYKGGLNGALFITLLRRMMHRRRKPLHLILDGLPAYKTRAVRDYMKFHEVSGHPRFLQKFQDTHDSSRIVGVPNVVGCPECCGVSRLL